MKFEPGLFENKSFVGLKGAAPVLFILFLCKAIKNGLNELTFSLTDISQYGITAAKFKYGMNELVKSGIIIQVYKGGAGAGDKSIYSLSKEWIDTVKVDTEPKTKSQDEIYKMITDGIMNKESRFFIGEIHKTIISKVKKLRILDDSDPGKKFWIDPSKCYRYRRYMPITYADCIYPISEIFNFLLNEQFKLFEGLKALESSILRVCILINAEDLNKKDWPYIKRLLDIHIVIMSGTQEVHDYLQKKHKGIYRRFKFFNI